MPTDPADMPFYPTERGECEICHGGGEAQNLAYLLFDAEDEEAGWLACARCYGRARRQAKTKYDEARERRPVTPGKYQPQG